MGFIILKESSKNIKYVSIQSFRNKVKWAKKFRIIILLMTVAVSIYSG